MQMKERNNKTFGIVKYSELWICFTLFPIMSQHFVDFQHFRFLRSEISNSRNRNSWNFGKFLKFEIVQLSCQLYSPYTLSIFVIFNCRDSRSPEFLEFEIV